MERTRSNFNIAKVLEEEKKKIIPGHRRIQRNSIFNVRTQKGRTLIPSFPVNAIDSYTKKKKGKKKNRKPR